MAFRADIVKMIEDLVTKIEDHHFKVNYSMKQDFVTFINSFFKFHLDQSDINFTLNANLLYADTDGVKVIIATDSTMAYAVPGCTIPMRDQIEAFIVVDEVVAYDSYKMRRFRQATRDPSSPVQITTTPVPLASAQATSPFPATAPSQDIFTTVTPPSISSFNISPPRGFYTGDNVHSFLQLLYTSYYDFFYSRCYNVHSFFLQLFYTSC